MNCLQQKCEMSVHRVEFVGTVGLATSRETSFSIGTPGEEALGLGGGSLN